VEEREWDRHEEIRAAGGSARRRGGAVGLRELEFVEFECVECKYKRGRGFDGFDDDNCRGVGRVMRVDSEGDAS
jgi:hypothetical protein